MLSHKMKKRLKKSMKSLKSFKWDQALSKGKMIFSEQVALSTRWATWS